MQCVSYAGNFPTDSKYYHGYRGADHIQVFKTDLIPDFSSYNYT